MHIEKEKKISANIALDITLSFLIIKIKEIC